MVEFNQADRQPPVVLLTVLSQNGKGTGEAKSFAPCRFQATI